MWPLLAAQCSGILWATESANRISERRDHLSSSATIRVIAKQQCNVQPMNDKGYQLATRRMLPAAFACRDAGTSGAIGSHH
jgi:hypothetical protein